MNVLVRLVTSVFALPLPPSHVFCTQASAACFGGPHTSKRVSSCTSTCRGTTGAYGGRGMSRLLFVWMTVTLGFIWQDEDACL